MANHLLTVPEYYKRFIDSSVDLNVTTKVCCPFHKEATPSFSYSPERGTWRCFGACKCGGDVIALHMKNAKLHTRAEAKKSLFDLLGIKHEVSFNYKRPEVNEESVRQHLAYAEALSLAKTVDDWIELDYIMSIYPIDVKKLEVFNNVRRVQE